MSGKSQRGSAFFPRPTFTENQTASPNVAWLRFGFSLASASWLLRAQGDCAPVGAAAGFARGCSLA